MTFDLLLVGFGNVGRRFVRLLHESRDRLDFDPRVLGIATRMHGHAFNQRGLNALRLAVLNRKSLPSPGSKPSQRAASTRKKWPLEKSSTLPLISRTRSIARSARAPT